MKEAVWQTRRGGFGLRTGLCIAACIAVCAAAWAEEASPAPANPYTGKTTVTQVHDYRNGFPGAADLSGGWWYNSATGEIRCHVPDSVTTSDGTQVNGM